MTGLATYLETQRVNRFKWGRNDCMTFVDGALRAQGRRGLPSGWIGGYSTAKGAVKHYRRLLATTGHDSIIDAMDHLYDRAITLYPSDGDIAARPAVGDVLGLAFGVAINGRLLFLNENGLTDQNVTACDLFWRAS